MGLFGGSKRTSITETRTDVRNVSQGFEDIAGPAIAAGEGAIVTLSDQGALSAAKSIAESGIVASREAVADSLHFSDRASTRAFDALGALSGTSFNFARDLFDKSIETVGDVVKSGQAQLGSTVTALNSIAKEQSTSSDQRVQRIALYAISGVVVALVLGAIAARYAR